MKNIKILIFILWLILVILWNYGFPSASPLLDVIAAILLAFFQILVMKFLSKT
tara:strand:- start:244 stop:402 length:159 start_codon:yes stop_codon:yes gene_type:complete